MNRRGAFWYQVAAGLLIGIGCVLPGVSGGAMAVSFGLYLPMLEAVLHFFRDVKKNVRLLLPLALGGALGFVLGATALRLAMARYEAATLFLFIGFIAGGIPDLLRDADGENGFQPRYLWALALGLGLGLLLLLLPRQAAPAARLSPLQALLAGGIEGVGTVVPGLSSSFVLLYLGWYQAFLTAVSTLDARTLCFFAAGFAIMALLCMRAIEWLFRRARGYAFYAVLGFLLVSVGLIFPGFTPGRGLATELLALLLGLLGALWMRKLRPPPPL